MDPENDTQTDQATETAPGTTTTTTSTPAATPDLSEADGLLEGVGDVNAEETAGASADAAENEDEQDTAAGGADTAAADGTTAAEATTATATAAAGTADAGAGATGTAATTATTTAGTTGTTATAQTGQQQGGGTTATTATAAAVDPTLDTDVQTFNTRAQAHAAEWAALQKKIADKTYDPIDEGADLARLTMERESLRDAEPQLRQRLHQRQAQTVEGEWAQWGKLNPDVTLADARRAWQEEADALAARGFTGERLLARLELRFETRIGEMKKTKTDAAAARTPPAPVTPPAPKPGTAAPKPAAVPPAKAPAKPAGTSFSPPAKGGAPAGGGQQRLPRAATPDEDFDRRFARDAGEFLS